MPATLAPKKSTNVRSTPPGFALISLLSTVAPSVAASVARRAMFTPPRKRPSVGGASFLQTGVRSDMPHNRGRLAIWRWTPAADGPRPTVACLHGWGGASSQFRSIVEALVRKGAAVIAFDAPGHGQSTGRTSSILAMRDALQAVVEREAGVSAVVAHSGGAAATALAMADGLDVDRAVFVGPTIDPAAWIEEAARAAGLSPAVLSRVRERTEREFGLPWTTLRVLPHAPTRTQPLLVVHDRDDAEVPWTDGADLVDAWPGARLLLTRGLGHRKVLHDPVVARAIADFVV